MGGAELSVALAVGGVLLAAWSDARLGDSRRPGDPMWRIAHAAIGFTLLQIAVAVLSYVKGAGGGEVALMLGLFGLVVPTLVYAFLGGLWLLRTLAEVAHVGGR